MPPIDNIINYKKQKNELQKNKKITIFFQKRTKYNIFQKHFIVNIKIILSFGILSFGIFFTVVLIIKC